MEGLGVARAILHPASCMPFNSDWQYKVQACSIFRTLVNITQIGISKLYVAYEVHDREADAVLRTTVSDMSNLGLMSDTTGTTMDK